MNVLWLPYSTQIEESYQISLLESDVSTCRSNQDNSGTEDLKYNHIWTSAYRKKMYF